MERLITIRDKYLLYKKILETITDGDKQNENLTVFKNHLPIEKILEMYNFILECEKYGIDLLPLENEKVTIN